MLATACKIEAITDRVSSYVALGEMYPQFKILDKTKPKKSRA